MAPLTLADYRRLLDGRGYSQTTDTFAVDDAINEARRHVFTYRPWTFLTATSSALSTAVGVSTVSLTSLANLVEIESVRLGTDNAPLEPHDAYELRGLVSQYPRTSQPSHWSRYGTGLQLWPVPNAVYPLAIDYVIEPADLVNPTDVCVIPRAHASAVTWRASVILAYRQRDYNSISYAERSADQALAKMASSDGVNLHGANLVHASNFYDDAAF